MDLAPQKTVLLIEDHPATRHLITVVLERFEVNLVFAADGRSGLEAIDAHEPDLVLLDLLLPDINGWEVLAWIRARRSGDELPVLMVTAYGGDDDETKAYELGANGYLPKPFDPSILRQTVAELLGGCLTP
ncbi:MAG TPA: response regulator [Acidimicrobiia bacterium]|nr:response regulator [Acidimicrobiia bacterium]